MTINRYTALIHPCRHAEIWKRQNTTIFITSILLFASAFGCIIFLSPVCIVETLNGELMGKITKNSILTVMYSVAGLFLIGSTVSMLICYGIIFKVLSKRKKESQKIIIVGQNFIVKAVIQRKRESKLLKMSVIVCLIQLSITIYVISKFLFDLDPQNFVYNELNSLYSTSSTYLLIIFSDVIRKRLKTVFCQQLLPSAKVSTTYLIHFSRKY